MSSNLPQFPHVSPSQDSDEIWQDRVLREPGPTRKEWAISAALLIATICSTSFAGLIYGIGDVDPFSALRAFLHHPNLIVYGLPFSLPFIAILLAHELGHFFACRYYGMRCTPPYFLPLPISIAGTLGAFIRIKSQFRHRRALFDIGIAGPLAGFVLVIPFLWIGISLSHLVPKAPIPPGSWIFGEPLIFQFFGLIVLGYSPGHQEIVAHPMAMSAWFGLLATSLNLLPIWQLDGGHITYAILGRIRQKRLSAIALIALGLLGLFEWRTPTYLVFGTLLLIIAVRMRFYHPPTLFEEDKLGKGRLLLGLIALLVLILSFIPFPVSIG